MKQSSRAPVVHSIDVGLGYVKHTKRGPTGKIEYDSFPALAFASDPSSLRQIGSRNRDTIDVPVTISGGVVSHYEVGHDIEQAQTGTEFGRDVTAGYYTSAIYDALMLGALRFTGDTSIDILVVGLPVSQYLVEERRQYLEARWTKPEGIDTGDGFIVKVKKVIVRPQPLGGYVASLKHLDLINAAFQASPAAQFVPKLTSAAEVIGMTVLVIDPGEFTLDWLVVTKGSIIERASGAAESAGRHKVVTAVADALKADVQRQLPAVVHKHINKALLEGRHLKLAGQYYDLSKYEGVVRAAILDPMNELEAGLKSVTDLLELVVIVGGHPELYRKDVVERFPSLPVVVLPNSVTANVEGYQDIGEQVAKQLELQAA